MPAFIGHGNNFQLPGIRLLKFFNFRDGCQTIRTGTCHKIQDNKVFFIRGQFLPLSAIQQCPYMQILHSLTYFWQIHFLNGFMLGHCCPYRTIDDHHHTHQFIYTFHNYLFVCCRVEFSKTASGISIVYLASFGGNTYSLFSIFR
ncbi:hypothetical protein D3C86_1162820 [compost metagenome]